VVTAVRRGTANMLVTLDNARVIARLHTLTDRCDILALQEWHGGRNRMLGDLGRLLRWLRLRNIRTNRPDRGAWTFHRARLGGGPIGVRNELGETALTCKAKILAAPGYVGRVPGKRSFLGPSYATRLKSRRADGSIVVRYVIHLTAGVQAGKHGYRHDEPAQRRVIRHRNERDRLERLVERDQAHGHDVEVYGDTNYHQMPIPGLHGWWPVRPDAATFRGRAIDGIWTSERPDRVRLLPPLVPGEHRHVITHTEER
jgi:hypothetical protein